MKISLKIVTLGLVIATAVATISLVSVSAEDTLTADEQHISNIRDNCVTAKNTLNQLHASDALLRVNMGQMYELMSTKLMDRFNARVSSNRYDNSSLTAVTSAYNKKLDSFRTDYQAYEVQLANTLKIDCNNQPIAFYDSVASSRSKRQTVHTDVSRLNQYLDDYTTALNAFENVYKSQNDVKADS